MRATRPAAVAAALLTVALLPLTAATAVEPRAVVAPTAVTGDPVGGPALGAAGIVLKAGPGTTTLPKIDADAWVLADITTGDVLAAKAPHKQVLPASTLKTLTAVTLMPVLPKDQVVTINDAVTHADGSHVGLVSGSTYTVWDLWHGLLLPSGNDAAAALADANGGMAVTVKAMQAKAIELGALDTRVLNDSGLDNLRQHTSAYDMALFARAAMSNPDFATVTKTSSYNFPGRPAKAGATRSTYKIYTQNRLLLHGFPGTVGGKTGFTSLGHRTFWGAVERGGHTLVVTIFQVRQPTEQAAKALITWGFANRTRLTPVGTLVAPTAPTAEPSPEGSTSAAAGAGADGTSAIGEGTTAVSLGSTLRLLLVPIALVVVVGGLAWWFLRRRPRSPAAGPVLLTPPAPDSTPVVILPVVAPDSTAPDSTAPDDTAPVPVVRTGRPTPPAPIEEPASAPTADEPAPAQPPAPTPRPQTSGNVRIVRPGQDPDSR